MQQVNDWSLTKHVAELNSCRAVIPASRRQFFHNNNNLKCFVCDNFNFFLCLLLLLFKINTITFQ